MLTCRNVKTQRTEWKRIRIEMDEQESPNGFCKLFNFGSTNVKVDDKDVAESAKSASKVKNDKCGCADVDGVDLKSGSDYGQLPGWCHPHPTISICESQKCQMDMLGTSVKSLNSKVVKLKSMGDKIVSTISKLKLYQIKLQNMLLATQICCHCSTDVKGSDISAKIVEVSNEAAILEIECMKLMFKRAYFMFVNQVAHTSHWHQMVSFIASCASSGRLTKFQQLCPTNGHTYPKQV